MCSNPELFCGKHSIEPIDQPILNYCQEDDERVIEITRLAWPEVMIWKVIEDGFGPRGGQPWWQHKVAPLLAAAHGRP